MPRITYENETVIDEANADLSILEISLKHGVPHMHACGGNARCSTCRVLITEGLANCPAQRSRANPGRAPRL